MIKSLLILSLIFAFSSCGDIAPQGTEDQSPFTCEESSCVKDTNWTINYLGSDIPNNISLKIHDTVLLNECIGSESYPFEVTGRTTTGLTIKSVGLYFKTPESTVSVEISDCSKKNNNIIFKSTNASYNSSLSNILINLNF